MNVEKARLVSLIEFAQQSVRLRGKAVASVREHGHFVLHEHEIQGLPGVNINTSDADGGDEVWLVIKRHHETKPPEITSPILRPWVRITQNPAEQPRLKESTDGSSLIESGTHCSSANPPQRDKPQIDPKTTLFLSTYERADHVRAEFEIYLNTEWLSWARNEKLRRRAIAIYSKLFTLKQLLEDGIVETQVELVWGIGLAIWEAGGATLGYPLITRSVELSLNPETADLEIRPRDVDPHLETDWYASVDNPGVAELEKAGREFFGRSETTLSPFDRGSFEPLLRTAVANLDPNGIYWPDAAPAEDRSLPQPDEKLKVTDTWVLFARPRASNLFLQDLESLKKRAEESESYPGAVAAIVTDPDTANPVSDFPSFRGVSGGSSLGAGVGDRQVRELYFPKPYNDEQVRIVQLLEASHGVVVQGPPGTGKTHTIANVICHYLAEGKRVLVTSMKDPALAVLQGHLPDEIRPLAIALLTSEQEGMKQFEHAIHKIASEVQSLDRVGTARDIRHLEDTVDALHGKLSFIDRKITEFAKRNLSKVTLEGEEIRPEDAAREVVRSGGGFEWLPDALGPGPEFAPQFSNGDVVRLRGARRALGPDIDYLGASLPQIVEFPDAKTLLQVHQDLSRFEKLKEVVERGGVPSLADSSQETLSRARFLLTEIEKLRGLRADISQAGHPWTEDLRVLLRRPSDPDLLGALDSLGRELEEAVQQRRQFLESPVTAPEGIELDAECVRAVCNLRDGRMPFGLAGLVGKRKQRELLDGIRVVGKHPSDGLGWKHVHGYLDFRNRLRSLALRWGALAEELPLGHVATGTPEGGLRAAEHFRLYCKVRELVATEDQVRSAAAQVFPGWPYKREVVEDDERLSELESGLAHHLTKNRLSTVWATKERIQKVLDGRNGRIVDDIRGFLTVTLGNPATPDAEMQAKWSSLMAELSRVLGLRAQLDCVREICQKIEDSGAPQYAGLLKMPLTGTVDGLLPDNWRDVWRLRRLSTFLEGIDAHGELKQLAENRRRVEEDISRAYREVVAKRTWLKLAENASPSVRAALQAYLTAVQRIGKGTGKRAVRYRRDARQAASQANPAVPCWIMAHYRVSESLPAELGCFDLVVVDEASQSDLTALPALLRAKKVLIVGDDKQVSPEGVGLEEEKIRNLMSRFLGGQVEIYRQQMSPERSIYDLFKVVFAKSAVMLKEHFRCAAPIIEYSKREFYNHELRPLRMPKASERLDPPLVDVLVEDGFRKGDVNPAEAVFVVDEVKRIVCDPRMAGRSIGVVSLLGDKQAQEIWRRLLDELGPEIVQRHRVACGDARTFQGKERDIMFLSMVSAPNDVGAPLSRDTFAQRFNVAASRARDRMYLVRSVELGNLSDADRLRRGLIAHFASPFAQDEARVENLRQLCESDFERELYDELTQRGYRVTPQLRAGRYRIDMVLEGHNDARLAVECDGDKYHGPDKWADDMQRQRVMERAGWIFWRCFASAFIRRRSDVLDDLLKTLSQQGIDPIGAQGAPTSVHTEHRRIAISQGLPGTV